MLGDCGTAFVKEGGYGVLSTPNGFIAIKHLYAIFAPFYLKNKELCGAIMNCQTLLHIQSKIMFALIVLCGNMSSMLSYIAT